MVVIGGVVPIGARIGWVRASPARCGGALHCSAGTRRVQLSVYPSFCLKGLIHDDVVVSGASGREVVEELRRSGALDALFEGVFNCLCIRLLFERIDA